MFSWPVENKSGIFEWLHVPNITHTCKVTISVQSDRIREQMTAFLEAVPIMWEREVTGKRSSITGHSQRRNC